MLLIWFVFLNGICINHQVTIFDIIFLKKKSVSHFCIFCIYIVSFATLDSEPCTPKLQKRKRWIPCPCSLPLATNYFFLLARVCIVRMFFLSIRENKDWYHAPPIQNLYVIKTNFKFVQILKPKKMCKMQWPEFKIIPVGIYQKIIKISLRYPSNDY